jgi:hypothetical protein
VSIDTRLSKHPDASSAHERLAAWARDHGLTSSDTPTSRVWGEPGGRDLVWLFVGTKSGRQVELELRGLRDAGRGSFADELVSDLSYIVGAEVTSQCPTIPYEAVTSSWEQLRAQVLDPYLEACSDLTLGGG